LFQLKPLLIRQQLKFQLYYHWLLWVHSRPLRPIFCVIPNRSTHVPHLLKVVRHFAEAITVTGTESSKPFHTRALQREHCTGLLTNQILIASFILVSFSTETTSFKLALYKEWFANTFSCRMVCPSPISILLWPVSRNYD
jgi:hypothetical protein